MKTKRTNRLIALVLVVVMLVPMISIPTTAWSVDAETKYLEEDFNTKISMNESGTTIKVSEKNAENNVVTAHLYSKLMERAENDKYLLIPFKGVGNGLTLKKDENGNQVYEDKLDENGRRIPYPVMIPFLDAEGKEVRDAEGNLLMVQETTVVKKTLMTEKLDENGEVVTDYYGEPIMVPVYDENGEEVKVDDMEIAYIYDLDEYGRPKREYSEPIDGSYGPFVYKKDALGNLLYEKTEKLDEEGNPVLDENGEPVMIPATRPKLNFVFAYEQTEAYDTYNEGNVDQFLKLNNQSVAASDKGIIIQLDVMIHYDYDLTAENCGYEYKGAAKDPTAEIQLAKVNHKKINNTTTSTSNISLAQINLKTGALTNIGDKVPGATNLRQDVWHTVSFEIDLVYGTYTTYVTNLETGVTEQYGLFGNISPDNSSKGLTEIGIDAAQLVIAKCNKNTGAYDNVTENYEDMAYIGVDNVAVYKNENYVEREEIYEPEILNKISGETFNTRHIGMSPKAFGYESTPDTARIVADPTDPTGADRCVQVDFRGYRADNPDGYYIWASENAYGEKISDAVLYTDEEGNTWVRGTAGAYGNVSGEVWGDSIQTLVVNGETHEYDERAYRPYNIANPYFGFTEYEISDDEYLHLIDEAKVTVRNTNLKPTSKLYIVTSEWYDAMAGGGNVARVFAPGNPAMNVANTGNKIALQVKYYISEDAVGNIEMQMNSSNKNNGSNGWIDTIRVDAKKDGKVIVSYGQNYEVVAGSAAEVNRCEWFTINIVFNLDNQWEDIFLNGDYLYTLKPRNEFSGSSVNKDSWSIGKPIRNNVPADLAGYYLVDDVMIFNDKGIIDDIYNRASVENFDGLTAESDLTATGFATNIPSSVTFYDDSENGHASTLKLEMSLDIEADDSKLLFWTKDDEAAGVYENYKFVNKEKNLLMLNNKNAAQTYKGGVKYDAATDSWTLTKDGVSYVYKETTYAEYAIHKCLGENVNRKWTISNPGLGAATNTLIAADFELFIPENAGGLLQGNIKEYNNGRNKITTGLPLYTIDTATGNIGIGASTEGATLNIGEWNNVSVVINLRTGEVSLYVNNVWAVDGQLGDTNISFMKNEWITAMIPCAPGEAESLAGYVLLDDVRMFSVTDELVTIDGNRANFISATFNGVEVKEGDKFFITDDVEGYVEEKFIVEDYEDLLDASNMKDYELALRDVAPSGLRFTTEVDEDLLDELYEKYGEDNVKMGTVIVPADTVVGWETITIDQLEAERKVYRNIEFQEFYDDNIMAASLANIAEKNYARDFRAMAYVEITLTEMGNKAIICSDLMTANIAKVAHNFLNENDDLEGPLAEIVEKYDAAYRG